MLSDEARVQVFGCERVRALARCLGGSDGSSCCRFLRPALNHFVGCSSYSLWWWNMSVYFEVGLRTPAAELLRGRLGHFGSRF